MVAELSQCVVAEQDTDPSPSDHRDGQTAPREALGCPGGAEMQNTVGEAKWGAGPSSAAPPLAVGHTGIDVGFEGKALQSPHPGTSGWRLCIPQGQAAHTVGLQSKALGAGLPASQDHLG